MARGTQESGESVRVKTDNQSKHYVGQKIRLLRTFATKFSNDWATSFAGLLAYSLLTAMLPIAVALFGILGLILGNNNELTQIISNQIAQIVPTQSSTETSATQQAINLALQQLKKNAGYLVIIAILLAIFGGSRLFIAIETCLNVIYRVRPRPFLQQNLMAFGMLLLFIILIPLMVFAAAAPIVILTFLNDNPTLTNIPFFSAISSSPVITYLAASFGSLIVCFILFEAIYFVVPNQRMSWRNSWVGALVAATALELFLLLFPLYMRYGLSNYSGQVGFAVILLLFFYYFAIILILGAEVNAFFREGVRPLPNDLATFVSTMAGKLNQDIPATEASSHVNAQPTHLADKAHIVRTRAEEEQIQQENMQRQQSIASKALAKDRAKKQNRFHTAFFITALEVVIGSALVVFLEWLYLRRRRG